MTKVSAQTFEQVTKTYSAGKTLHRFLDFVNRKYFTDFEDNYFNCTAKLCYQHRNFQNKEAATGVLGLQLYLKKRLWHRCFPVNFVKFLRIPFWKTTGFQKMKVFELKVTSSAKVKIGWIHITFRIRYGKTSKTSSRASIFQRLF